MQKIMKILSVILIVTLSSAALFSQANTVFTVRLGNFFDPQPADFEDLRPVGFLFADSNVKTVIIITVRTSK